MMSPTLETKKAWSLLRATTLFALWVNRLGANFAGDRIAVEPREIGLGNPDFWSRISPGKTFRLECFGSLKTR